MLITENKVLRNLQEQVAKNKSDISDILEAKAVIAEFGIRVVGEVDTEAELPDPATYSGEYGDAYTVGIQAPYDYYIFTRPNDDIPQAHWFNVGEFPMPGPQGEPGLPGAKGDKGSMIYTEKFNPTLVTGYNVGDLWINTKDNALFQLNINGWDRVGYVKGDTGPQGPKGDKGDTGAPGTPLNIVGVLSTVDLLPQPSTVNKATAYLIGESAPYTIYVIVGDIDDTSTWAWQQLAVGGTNVTVNNQPVGTFNADSKLDKMTTTSDYNRAYIVKQDGSQTLLNCGSNAGSYTIVSRDGNSQIIVPETPTATNHAASKKYVDDNLKNKLDKVTSKSVYNKAYVKSSDGSQGLKDMGPNAGPWSLVERTSSSQVIVPETPTGTDNATSKKYVDTGLNNKLDKVTNSGSYWKAYVVTFDGNQDMKNLGPYAGPWSLIERDANSQIAVPETPAANDNAASKAYVDKMTTGTISLGSVTSPIDTGAKNGTTISIQGAKGVYAVNTDQFTGIVVVTSSTNGLMYGQVTSTITPGQSLQGHKLI